MWCTKNIFIFSLMLRIIFCENSEYVQLKWCIDSEYVGVDGAIVDKESCNIRPCIVSTTKQGFFQYKNEMFSMANKTFSLDFSEFYTIYKLKKGKLVLSDKKFDEQFQVVTYKQDKVYLSKNNKCTTRFIRIGKGEIFEGHFLDDGSFFLKEPNTTVPQGEYVVMFTAEVKSGGFKAALRLKIAKAGLRSIDIVMDQIFAYVSLVSCFFMILVLVVYTVIKELRTTAGLIQMSYVTVLAMYFLLVAIRDLSWTKIDTTGCYILSGLINLFDFTRLMWVNIMGFDIWWTLRSIFLCSTAPHRVNYKKFMWYCCIAWVPPLMYVTIEVLLDEFTIYGPRLRTCTADGNTWYTAGMMISLEIINTIVLVLTMSNLWRIQKSLKYLSNSESFTSGPKKNAYLIIKVSLLMGTDTLLMEIILFLFYGSLPDWFKYTARMYVASAGLILFVIFVLKVDVLLKFFKRLSVNNGITRYLEKRGASKYGRYISRGCTTDIQLSKETAIE